MDIIDTNNNVIRKALRLSLNEMAVLREIFMLSQSRKYDHYCVKSKANIAYTLDLSERTVFNIIEKLEMYNLIIKNDIGHLALSTFMEALVSERDNIALAISTDGYQLATSKIAERIIEDMKNNSEQYKIDYEKSADGMKKVRTTYAKNADNLCKNFIGGMQNFHTSNNNNNNTEEETIETYHERLFEEFRKIYKGSKRGLETEFAELKKKHKDWKEVCLIIKERYEKQLLKRDEDEKNNRFVPPHAGMGTYLNQRRWEIEVELDKKPADDIEQYRGLVGFKEILHGVEGYTWKVVGDRIFYTPPR